MEPKSVEFEIEIEGRKLTAKIDIEVIGTATEPNYLLLKIHDRGMFENGVKVSDGQGWTKFPVKYPTNQ